MGSKVPIKIISLNVKGLGSLEKRLDIFGEIKKFKAEILFMQETHFQKEKYPPIPDKKYNIRISLWLSR